MTRYGGFAKGVQLVELQRRGCAQPVVGCLWQSWNTSGNPQLLSIWRRRTRRGSEIVNHYNCSRCSTSTLTSIDAIWAAWVQPSKDHGRGFEEAQRTSLDLKGQVTTMRNSFRGWARYDRRRGSGIPADGCQFPVLARSIHHPHGAARRARWHCLDAVHHANHFQRPFLMGAIMYMSPPPAAF